MLTIRLHPDQILWKLQVFDHSIKQKHQKNFHENKSWKANHPVTLTLLDISYNLREWHRNERADYLLDRGGWPCRAEPEGAWTSTSIIWVTSGTLLWWQITCAKSEIEKNIVSYMCHSKTSQTLILLLLLLWNCYCKDWLLCEDLTQRMEDHADNAICIF